MEKAVGEARDPLILLVEDSETQATVLSRTLQENGYQVLMGKNGREGAALAEAHHPVLILSDILMPEMDGYRLCRVLKENPATAPIPVVLLTHLSEPEEVLQGLEAGADAFLSKPFRTEYLLGKVRALLSGDYNFLNRPERRCLEFDYGGRHYQVRSGRVQTIKFLLSTYENALFHYKEMLQIQEELKALNEQLEAKVREKTAILLTEVAERKQASSDLKKNLEDLERMNRLMVGRELKMEEFKQEIRVLRERIKGLEEGKGDASGEPLSV